MQFRRWEIMKKQLNDILNNEGTTSSKIRALAGAGCTRVEIRDLLGIRYQRVRNVLVAADIETPNSRTLKTKQNRSNIIIEPKPIPASILLDAGFVKAANWSLGGTHGIELNESLPKLPSVYAFVVNDAVMYIGKSSKNLSSRFYYYKRPGKHQSTNIKMKERILGLLKSGVSIEILIAHPEGTSWNGLPVSLVPGLEEGLIHRFQPPWNVLK